MASRRASLVVAKILHALQLNSGVPKVKVPSTLSIGNLTDSYYVTIQSTLSTS